MTGVPFIELKRNVSPLVIVREFGRDIPVECDGCGRGWPLRLYSDEILEQAQCDELLDAYLLEHGWTLEGGAELCPACGPDGDTVDSAGVKPERPIASVESSPGKGGP